MDNQNDSNSQNNPNPSLPTPSWPASSSQDGPPAPQPTTTDPNWPSAPVQLPPDPAAVNPWTTPAPAPIAPDPIPTPLAPVWSSAPEPAPTPPVAGLAPVTPTPAPAAPAADMWSTAPTLQSADPLAPSSIPAWVPSPEPAPIQPEPVLPPSPVLEPAIPVSPMAGSIPTFTPPSTPTPTNLSPLDNPWGAPLQPPTIDGSGEFHQPQNSTEPAPIQSEPTQPSWNVNQESAPTDLSHLINSNSPQTPTPIAPETLIAPSSGSTPEVPTLPVENHPSIPVWLIGIGAGLLVLVIGASAYFILGIGQPAKTTSLPVATTPATAQVIPPQPIATPFTQPTPVASGSANFGDLQGNGATPQASSSAMDALRQRQQQ